MSLNAMFYVILFMRLKLQNIKNVKKKKITRSPLSQGKKQHLKCQNRNMHDLSLLILYNQRSSKTKNPASRTDENVFCNSVEAFLIS